MTLKKILTMPYPAYLILAASAGALVFVFIMQFGFGIQPCELCWVQRGPFALAIIVAIIAIYRRPYGTQSRILLGVCAALFFINAGVAFFHTGVEQKWWSGTSGCHIPSLHAASVDDLRARIMNLATGHCDEISWTFLGFSMANWNIPFCLLLGIFASLAAYHDPDRYRL